MFMVLALGLIFALPHYGVAQHFSVGMKTGVATLEPISVTGIFARQSHPLIFGPVIEAALPRDLGVEVGALHRQIAYRWQTLLTDFTSSPITAQQLQTGAHSWEVPLTVKKYMGSRLRAFGEVGFAFRHTSSTTNAHGLFLRQHPGPGPPGPPSYDVIGSFSQDMKTPELVREWSHGVVIGAGQDIRIHSFRLQPELRYTRWSNSPFAKGPFPPALPLLALTSSVTSKRDTFDFAVSLSYTR
jgi:hypothetical protein